VLSEIFKLLDFPQLNQQIAILENLYFAGFLNKDLVNKGLFLLGNFAPAQENHLNITFEEAGAYQNKVNKFYPQYIINNLSLSKGDMIDLVVYLCQRGFGRRKGEEREHLKRQPWMDQFKEAYLENARLLQMIDQVGPVIRNSNGKEIIPDETWVLGGSFPRMRIRTQDVDHYQFLRVSTGERDLTTQLDKAENILSVADFREIKYSKEIPFITHSDRQEYLNVLPGNKQVTETDIAYYLLSENLDSNSNNISIVDSKKIDNERPNTYGAAIDTVKLTIQRIKNKELQNHNLHIRVISNQPFIKRQEYVNQLAVDEMLEKYKLDKIITIHGTGRSCSVGIEYIQSEFAALILERAKPFITRDLSKLLYY
jgi:hypothetical protein